MGRGCREEPGEGRYLLKRGRDLKKDQSYFLFSLRQDQLARALFPLGEKTKSDTREVARHCQLKTADKEESMEICFVPDNNYGGFLQQAGLAHKHRGEIVDLHGNVLGHHDGIEFYTIGQRKASASRRPSRSMSSNWTRKTIASSSVTNRRSTATSSPQRIATGFRSTNWPNQSKP